MENRSLMTRNLAKQVIRQRLEQKGLDACCFLAPTAEEASETIRSIVVVLFPYYAGVREGNLSLYCRGKDYHCVVPEYLDPICREAEEILGEGAQCHAYADTGPLKDRFLALRAGLGKIGRNQMMINETYGSYFFIAYMTISEALEPDPIPAYVDGIDCLFCDRCAKACPGGCMKPDGTFAWERCLSGITQKKGELEAWEVEILRKESMVFGCDVCQNVCPLNQKAAITPIREFVEDRMDYLMLEDLEGLSRRTFKEKYKDRAFTWRGPEVIRRNLRYLMSEGEDNQAGGENAAPGDSTYGD